MVGFIITTYIFQFYLPKASLVPEGNLIEKINQTFGNVDNLKDELSKKAIAQFGSGYASLLMDRNKNLFIKIYIKPRHKPSRWFSPYTYN
ncbi:Fe-Mn family superoxide dismutase [Paraclostridium bifermentans]|nr:Fe-Mn family superoxide dismutase [Paraclostridium bifermentans]